MSEPVSYPKFRELPLQQQADELSVATLRDRFAMAALQGMLASNGADWDIGPDKRYTARECYQYADAMLKARQEKKS